MAVSMPPTVAKVLFFQCVIILVVSTAFVVGGWQKAFSSALGGVAAFIPNLFFALKISMSSGQGARKIVRSFYVGESIKLLLTALLFVLIIQVPSIEVLPLLVGYISALMVFWFALLMR